MKKTRLRVHVTSNNAFLNKCVCDSFSHFAAENYLLPKTEGVIDVVEFSTEGYIECSPITIFAFTGKIQSGVFSCW